MVGHISKWCILTGTYTASESSEGSCYCCGMARLSSLEDVNLSVSIVVYELFIVSMHIDLDVCV
eukprot:scaffold73691_cov47-Attheya_sp.AAC.3